MDMHRSTRIIKAGLPTLSGYPRQVKALVATNLISSLGGNILFPYWALYLTYRLNFAPGITALILTARGLASLLFVFLSGSLADRIGRKKQFLFASGATAGLVALFPFISTFPQFLAVALTLGFAGALGDPASSAMVADLMPPRRREEVYGLLYQVGNVGTVLGPVIGGFLILAQNSYNTIFVLSALLFAASSALAVITFKETYTPGEGEFIFVKGLREVVSNRLFVAFCFLGFATAIVYQQLYSLLGVYMKYEGLPEYLYGIAFSVNGLMVVLLQIPIRLWVMRMRKTSAFILAQAFYTVGFTLFAFSHSFPEFLAGTMILTIGEITFVPANNAFIANLAPQDKRGRYIGFSSLFYGAGSTLGTLIGLQLFGSLATPSEVWLILGVAALITTIGYAVYRRRVSQAVIRGRETGQPLPDGV